jgi:hypothetical protein
MKSSRDNELSNDTPRAANEHQPADLRYWSARVTPERF